MINFIKLLSPYFYGNQKRYARWAGVLLLLLSQVSTGFAYLFIEWNRRFYDALEAKNPELFIRESLVFAGLAISYVLVFSLNRYFCQQYALRWRIWMTKNALGFWLHDTKRGEIEGSDQRIQEDLMRFTTLFERFFLDSFNAVLLILLFIPLLFSQTAQLYINNFHLSWVLLFSVLIYTFVGMIVSARIANPLIQNEYDNQKLEADFRYNLVHVRDGAYKNISFFESMLSKLTTNYQTIYTRQKYFNLWQKGYDQFSFLIPFALLASNYFAGFMTLGMLMQIKSTFSRIRNSMAYLLDHYTEFTELLAISRRLVEFYASARQTARTIVPATANQINTVI